MIRNVQAEKVAETHMSRRVAGGTFDPDRLAELEIGGLKAYYDRK